MTQEQIDKGRIAIAAQCGWTMLSTNHKGALMGFAPLIPEMDECQWLAVPNYHGSLDAMHEVEKMLKGLEPSYIKNLAEICYAEWPNNHSKEFATAPQRFEAFLKTIEKWEE